MQILPPFIEARMAEIAAELYPLCCRGRQVLKNIHPPPPPSFSSFPSENCSFMYFCVGTWSFWYYSLHCWEEMIFQHQVWSHLHSKPVTSWREGNSVWDLVSHGKEGDLSAYLWEEVGAVDSPGWLEEGAEETTVRVPACYSGQQQCIGDRL